MAAILSSTDENISDLDSIEIFPYLLANLVKKTYISCQKHKSLLLLPQLLTGRHFISFRFIIKPEVNFMGISNQTEHNRT
jgi:hypothetical protein